MLFVYEELFRQIGLTKGETKVYLALLGLGEKTVSPIAKEAEVSLSKIYEILYNLIKKGLVSSITKNNVKYFLAADPIHIIDYLEQKKKEINKSEEGIKTIIPFLQLQKETIGHEPIATLYEGFTGIKTFYEVVLKSASRGDEILVIGIPRYSAEKYEGYFLNWNKRRAQKGISIKIIFNYNVRDLGKKREKIRFTDIRYLPKDLTTPAWILIYKGGVATIHLTEKPICVFIQDRAVIASYMIFFRTFWEISTK